MNTVNEKTNKTDATPYAAGDSDLPKEFWPAEPKPDAVVTVPRNRFLETRQRVLREARELGITVTPQQVDLCTIILFSIQQDEEREGKQPGGDDGNRKAK